MQCDFFATIPAARQYDLTHIINLLLRARIVRKSFQPTNEHRAYFESLILSPITSYTDQILSIHRARTSAGFSLDIPFIMLTASILKIFYWPGARYDIALLVQAMIMIVVQMILLKVSLDNRPSWRGEGPFAPKADGRPFNFWRWRLQRPYVRV